MRGVQWVMVVVGLVGCAQHEPVECLERCRAIEAAPEVCRELCTRSCDELERTYGMSAEMCRELQVGGPRFEKTAEVEVPAGAPAMPMPGPTADRTGLCADFVTFAWGCGIGRPEPDPTVDVGTQRSNDLVVWQAVVARCQQRSPPYDEGLLDCFAAAGASCEVYRACADRVVKARGP